MTKMKLCSTNANPAIQPSTPQVGIYECEVTLKFRLIEEELAQCDRDQLLQILIDAYSYGSDNYLEPLQADVRVQEVAELDASPEMRRQVIRLRNAGGLK
ncbi:Npun_R1517 family heterocyst differentiation transcriptional regulator [Leptolyngbya iicbica]|nr:Npun_R1517 family heterocyst differentiation transcriptional regulator [Leptolyngbya sp. LK]